MNFNKAIKKVVADRNFELTDGQRERTSYSYNKPENLVGEVLTIDYFHLTDMTVDPEKPKRNGKGTYYSSECVLECYSDDEAMKVVFFIQVFDNYNEETGELRVRRNNPLYGLINKDSDENPLEYVVDFNLIQEILEEESGVEITIEERVRNENYSDYVIL